MDEFKFDEFKLDEFKNYIDWSLCENYNAMEILRRDYYRHINSKLYAAEYFNTIIKFLLTNKLGCSDLMNLVLGYLDLSEIIYRFQCSFDYDSYFIREMSEEELFRPIKLLLKFETNLFEFGELNNNNKITRSITESDLFGVCGIGLKKYFNKHNNEKKYKRKNKFYRSQYKILMD